MKAKYWLERAKKEKFAIGAFNVGNLETFKAVVQAAASKKSPIIIESSPGETKWMGVDNVVDLAKNYSQNFGIPILVNLDHAETLEDCQAGIEAGYDLIHFDGSKLPLEQNIEITKKVTELAHTKGLTCEGELDHIGGSSELHLGSAKKEASKIPMTDPQKASEFVKATGVDIFAAFVGNIHGLYLGENKNLDITRLAQIAAVTNCYLSLHGSSGVSEQQLKEAIKNGIVKINLNTEIRKAYKDSLEQVLKDDPNEYAMYKSEQPVIEAIQKIVESKLQIFGSSGKL